MLEKINESHLSININHHINSDARRIASNGSFWFLLGWRATDWNVIYSAIIPIIHYDMNSNLECSVFRATSAYQDLMPPQQNGRFYFTCTLHHTHTRTHELYSYAACKSNWLAQIAFLWQERQNAKESQTRTIKKTWKPWALIMVRIIQEHAWRDSWNEWLHELFKNTMDGWMNCCPNGFFNFSVSRVHATRERYLSALKTIIESKNA